MVLKTEHTPMFRVPETGAECEALRRRTGLSCEGGGNSRNVVTPSKSGTTSMVIEIKIENSVTRTGSGLGEAKNGQPLTKK